MSKPDDERPPDAFTRMLMSNPRVRLVKPSGKDFIIGGFQPTEKTERVAEPAPGGAVTAQDGRSDPGRPNPTPTPKRRS